MQPTSSSLYSDDILDIKRRQKIVKKLGKKLKITIKIPQSDSRIKARVCKISLKEMTFKYLQKNLGFSRQELAQYFREMQALNSSLEGQEILDIKTLQEVVIALGGTLKITIESKVLKLI